MTNNTTADTAASGAGEGWAGMGLYSAGRLRDYADANDAPLGCSCGDCSQCAASYLTPNEAIEIAGVIDTLRAQLEAAEARHAATERDACQQAERANEWKQAAEDQNRRRQEAVERAEAAEADAARYRWLRDRMVPAELTCATAASFVGSTTGPVGVRPADDCDAAEFDAAIDAARAATP